MASFNIDIDLLAPIIFCRNNNDLPILLNLEDPLKNPKDIFYFCTDLFFKGLYYMHNDSGNKVVINNLSVEQIYKVIAKLKNAKINTILNIINNDVDQKQAHAIIDKSLCNVMSMNEYNDMDNYFLSIPINGVLYSISFKLFA